MDPDTMRYQIVAAVDLFISKNHVSVHLRPEAPGVGLSALGHLGVVQEPALLSPINQGSHQLAAVHRGCAYVEMVGGVQREVRGPVLETALNARRVEFGRRHLRRLLVRAAGYQWNNKKQCSHSVKVRPAIGSLPAFAPLYRKFAIAVIRSKLTARTISGCLQGSRGNNHK